MPKSYAFRDRIRQIRENQGLTQAEFAKAIGVQPYQIADIERGKTDPSVWILASIAFMFDIPGDWLLLNEARSTESIAGKKDAPTQSDLDLIKLLRRHFSGKEEPRFMVVWKPKDKGKFKEDDCVFVPVVAGIEAMACPKLRDEQVLGYSPMMARLVPHPERVRCLRLTDEDMAPLLPPGSIIAVDLDQKDPAKLTGAIVCVKGASTKIFIRHFQCEGDHWVFTRPEIPGVAKEPGMVLPAKENPAPIIGKVIWAWLDLRQGPWSLGPTTTSR